MNFKSGLTVLALSASSVLLASNNHAATLDIEISNLTHGIYFTPLLVSAHNGSDHLFQLGTSASSELQAMAEGGDISGLATVASSVGANNIENPAGGLLAPGASASITDMDTGSNTALSIVGMLLPTNDGFVGLDSWPIPSEAGTYILTLNGYDAGTEANNEVVNGDTGGMPGMDGFPANPGMNGGTGASGMTTSEENTNVHIHRGNIGDTDAEGGNSDVDSRIHRWLNPVAKVTVTVK